MPDTNSPNVTMADEDLRSMLRKNGIFPARRWSCPEDDVLAGYADGALRDTRKKWVEFHLSGCLRCRLVVADVVKAQSEVDPSPPAELSWKAIGLAEPNPAPRRWVWIPAGALATAALLIVSVVVLRKPESLFLPSPPSPSAPLIAKTEPLVAPRTAVRNLVRKPTSSELLPSIVLPRPDSVVRRDQLKFGWKSVPRARYYEVHVVTTDGDLVWRGETEKADLQLPADVVVRDGPYFVWITAFSTDGRIAKSAPVKFMLKQ